MESHAEQVVIRVDGPSSQSAEDEEKVLLSPSQTVDSIVGLSGKRDANLENEEALKSGLEKVTIIPFVPSKLYSAAKWTLDLLDDWGEKLAWFFGITSPKYAIEISHQKRVAAQEVVRAHNQAKQFAGWNNPSSVSSSSSPPAPSSQLHSQNLTCDSGHDNHALDCSNELQT